MNQAQQSAKWNPRDSMNFREQGAFTEGQKPLRNIQQQTERSLHGAEDKETAGSFSVCQRDQYTGAAQPGVL